MTEEEFIIKTHRTFVALYGIMPIQEQISIKANQWTEMRDAFLTTELQKMDDCPTLESAEKCWIQICSHPLLKFVKPETVNYRAVEIRML
jgi:hypothetical protein